MKYAPTFNPPSSETVMVDGITYDLDLLTRAMYDQRSRSPHPMDDERWKRVKAHFRGSVAQCRRDVLQQIEDGEF